MNITKSNLDPNALKEQRTGQVQDNLSDLLSRRDKDRDGRLSKEEAGIHENQFKSIDSNKDGYVTRRELLNMRTLLNHQILENRTRQNNPYSYQLMYDYEMEELAAVEQIDSFELTADTLKKQPKINFPVIKDNFFYQKLKEQEAQEEKFDLSAMLTDDIEQGELVDLKI